MKRLSVAFWCLILVLGFSACDTLEMSLYFHVDNGEEIKVTLDITDGHWLTTLEDGRLAVTKDDQVLLSGGFVEEEVDLSDVEILELTPEDDPAFGVFTFENDSGEPVYGFVEAIDGDSDLLVLMYSDNLPMEEAREAYGKLKFEKLES